MKDGFAFFWPSGRNPFFVTPHKKLVDLDVDGDIPYIPGNAKPRAAKNEELGYIEMLFPGSSRRNSLVASCIDRGDLEALIDDLGSDDNVPGVPAISEGLCPETRSEVRDEEVRLLIKDVGCREAHGDVDGRGSGNSARGAH